MRRNAGARFQFARPARRSRRTRVFRSYRFGPAATTRVYARVRRAARRVSPRRHNHRAAMFDRHICVFLTGVGATYRAGTPRPAEYSAAPDLSVRRNHRTIRRTLRTPHTDPVRPRRAMRRTRRQTIAAARADRARTGSVLRYAFFRTERARSITNDDVEPSSAGGKRSLRVHSYAVSDPGAERWLARDVSSRHPPGSRSTTRRTNRILDGLWALSNFVIQIGTCATEELRFFERSPRGRA
jgi:hypothetical protein